MRAISDYLAKDFAALGFRVVAHEIDGGKQYLKFESGASIHVSPFASDAEIMAAARDAHNMTDDNIETSDPVPPTAEKMPMVDLAPAIQKPTAAKPIPAGSHAPGTLAALLKGLRDRKAAVIDNAISEAKRAHKALDHVERATSDITATADGIMSELGQFSNFGDDDESSQGLE
jgi:hypothetical protein